MKLIPRNDLSDKFCCVCCVVGSYNPHHMKHSIRPGTLFKLSNLAIPDVLAFMRCAKFPYCFIAEQLASFTVTSWTNTFREICFEIYINDERKIEGPWTVEISESRFGEKKFERGKKVGYQWVFGEIERESSCCFFSPVQDRTKEGLPSVISEYILLETAVVSNLWKEYNCHSDEGFTHLKISHSLSYMDLEPVAHTNTIKETWSAIKRDCPCAGKASDFYSYLAEYIWRKSSVSTEEKMKSFFSICVQSYPPHTKDLDNALLQNKKQKLMTPERKTGH